MVGLGNAKIIEESVPDFGGMQIVYAARTLDSCTSWNCR